MKWTKPFENLFSKYSILPKQYKLFSEIKNQLNISNVLPVQRNAKAIEFVKKIMYYWMDDWNNQVQNGRGIPNVIFVQNAWQSNRYAISYFQFLYREISTYRIILVEKWVWKMNKFFLVDFSRFQVNWHSFSFGFAFPLIILWPNNLPKMNHMFIQSSAQKTNQILPKKFFWTLYEQHLWFLLMLSPCSE